MAYVEHFDALLAEGSPLFSKVLTPGALDDVSSLPKAKHAMEEFIALLAEANIKASVGFNAGTGSVSITIKLDDILVLGCDNGKFVTTGPKQSFVLRTALGLLHDQQAAEVTFQKHNCFNRGALPTKEGAPASAALANLCLQRLAEESGVAIVQRDVSLSVSGGTMRLGISCFSLLRSRSLSLYHYSPAYAKLSSCDESGYSKEALQGQCDAIAVEMNNIFWTEMCAASYICDERLKLAMTEDLIDMFARGTSQRIGFEPPKALSWYFHGRQGVGKSLFCRTFRRSLESVLKIFCDPDIDVRIVKVPLNVYTVDQLIAVSAVRGISDFSIERLVEQTIVKHSIVVLHFEECPEESEAQAKLMGVSHRMLAGLMRKYPEHKRRVFSFFTSNYAHCGDSGDGPLPRVFELPAPTAIQRSEWCRLMLRMQLMSWCRLADVGITIDSEADLTSSCSDLRVLRSWWLSLGFHAGRALRRLKRTVEETGEGDFSQLKASVIVNSSIDVSSKCFQPPPRYDRAYVPAVVSVELTSSALCAPLTEIVELAPLGSGMMGVSQGDHAAAAVANVAEMVQEAYLAPAVAVLHGSEDQQATIEETILDQLRNLLEKPPKIHRLTVRTEADSVEVFGRPQDIQGGVFAFINSVNGKGNSNLTDYGVIVASVSQVGQFIMRELLEDGASKTHRLSVAKDRILFILRLDSGTLPSAQTRSRAHLILPVL